jgi:UDP-N-acetylglucosamine acyltransferase
MPKIHPTAVVHPDAKLADDVEIGPYCVVESDVNIGAGTVLREHVVIRKYTTLGQGNFVDAHVVLGGEPQDLKFNFATKSSVRIGDDNVFRECVTISRATGEDNETVVGNGTYWMANAHAGHNATIEDNVILANGACVAGHATIGRRTILSAHVGVHQFTWVGEGVMTQGLSGLSAHTPPFVMTRGGINRLSGLNTIGLKRSPETTDEDVLQVSEAFRLTFRSGLTRAKALAEMDACADWGGPARRFREFIRRVHEAAPPFDRGLVRLRRK